MKKWLFTLLVVLFSVTTLTLPGDAQGSGGQTTMKIYNASNNSVRVNIQLDCVGGQGNPGFIDNVQQIPFRPSVQLSGSGKNGSFILAPGKATTFRTGLGIAVTGTWSFTPVSGDSGVVTAHEVLNNNTPSFGGGTQESTDINIGENNGYQVPIIKWDFYPSAGSGTWGVNGYGNKPNGLIEPVQQTQRPASTSGGTAQLTFVKFAPLPPPEEI